MAGSINDELNEKIVCLSVSAVKMTPSILKRLLEDYLKLHSTLKSTGAISPKKTIQRLMSEGEKLENIEITDSNIKSFDKVARRYGLTYALKKNVSWQ